MYLSKINIFNYKCFKGKFTMKFNENKNIIVGNNGSGKSTIIEAIDLVLSGIIDGKYLRNELNQYIFNKYATKEYIDSIHNESPIDLPKIIIELFFEGESPELNQLRGNNNTERLDASGVKLEIRFNENYQEEYEMLIENEKFSTLPMEYYGVYLESFADQLITRKNIPIKSVLVDSASKRYQNGSDIYISRIIRNNLDSKEKMKLSQSYRRIKEIFNEEEIIKTINNQLSDNLNGNNMEISVDLSSYNSWEKFLMTYLDEIPFHNIGKGDQNIIKSYLALKHEKTAESQILLVEEPENHLSHTKLNELINIINTEGENKQIIMSTHSSFVANKLSLDNLILLNDFQTFKLESLNEETYKFFKKLSGYKTLRLILSKKVVLVEGDSDELIFQKAYMSKNNRKLPIENGIDVISVGMSFKRFLEIAKNINKKVCVITDNDENYEVNICKKYEDYLNLENIKIFTNENKYLYTLEPSIVDVNKDELKILSNVVRNKNEENETLETITDFMLKNKTESALRIFESENNIKYPDYILKAVEWCNE